ncbi:MAG: long-chain-fatty-acid--CoA ligase [Actinomycetales bacterium]
MTNLAANLTNSARTHPERTAIRMDDFTLTYAEMDSLVDAAAALIRSKGVQPGDRVGIMLPNVPAFPVLFYAILRVGGTVVPMNPLFKEREVHYYLGDSGAKLLFAWHLSEQAATEGANDAGAELVVVNDIRTILPTDYEHADVVERADDDTAVILYTSGTTGRPKGAQLTHNNLNSNQELTGRTLLSLTPDDVVMGCLPLFHVFGLTVGLNSAIAVGACLTLLPRFDPAKALEIVERDKVSIFVGVPTMYAAMLANPEGANRDVNSLRICCSGGAAMPVEVMRAFEEKFGCMILEGYGLSETSPVACFNHPDRVRKPGSIGQPVAGVEMRLVDKERNVSAAGEVGEVQIRGNNIMSGYWDRPEATAEAIDSEGWFSSGDLGRVDEDGYYYIVDRAKDLIIRGGFNVYPREIEEVLYEHPAVAEAAVVGIPHESLGEEIGAAVALKSGAEPVTPEELVAFVKERVAAYKYPRRVWIEAELPKTATGKILRREVSVPEAVK